MLPTFQSQIVLFATCQKIEWNTCIKEENNGKIWIRKHKKKQRYKQTSSKTPNIEYMLSLKSQHVFFWKTTHNGIVKILRRIRKGNEILNTKQFSSASGGKTACNLKVISSFSTEAISAKSRTFVSSSFKSRDPSQKLHFSYFTSFEKVTSFTNSVRKRSPSPCTVVRGWTAAYNFFRVLFVLDRRITVFVEFFVFQAIFSSFLWDTKDCIFWPIRAFNLFTTIVHIPEEDDRIADLSFKKVYLAWCF